MSQTRRDNVLRLVREKADRVLNVTNDFGKLIEGIGDARFVLLGEASHGTHEFYQARAQITRLLIERKGFTAVAVEADWPDAYRVNRYVRAASRDSSADEALRGFVRFPTWMWRNTDVMRFVEWLRQWNRSLRRDATVTGFYGLVLYSLNSSRDAVIRYLSKVDPQAALRARYRYSCFDQFGEDTQAYGYAASYDLSESCEKDVVQQLQDLQRQAAEYASRDGQVAEEEYFYAEQNARLVKNAENYYRSMFSSRVSSWNLRDRHMAETLDELAKHLSKVASSPKVAVWAHNSHLGDARATEMSERGELNLGQLVRERYGPEVFNVGFTTHSGFVTAAHDWSGPAERMKVRPALPDSFEALFHDAEMSRFLLNLRNNDDLAEGLRTPLLERAIGVIYRPQSERLSHYFFARLADQFDAVIHFDETSAVEPLERIHEEYMQEAPEMYPSGV